MYTKTKILILDDHVELLEALTIFLESSSFEVCTVTSEVLFKKELTRFQPDLIILDVYVQSDCDGRNICKLIKNNNQTSHIPVILMSTSIELLKNYEECKADAVIDKPFDLVVLLATIHALAYYNIGDMITNKRNGNLSLKSLIKDNTPNDHNYAA